MRAYGEIGNSIHKFVFQSVYITKTLEFVGVDYLIGVFTNLGIYQVYFVELHNIYSSNRYTTIQHIYIQNVIIICINYL